MAHSFPKTILITGATAGIGRACARRLARPDRTLILTGRRHERLEALAGELPGKILPLAFDIRDKEAVGAALERLPEGGAEVEVLVNNAGLAAGYDLFQEARLDDWEQMIDTNLKGLLYISRLIAPKMAERGSGHIVNIGSIAGSEVYPRGNVYCASKHAVKAVSQGMRMDLLEHGVKVTHVAPGLVETEFSEVRFKGDKDRADRVYTGMEPLRGEDIALVVEFAVQLPPHVNIDDVLVLPTAQAAAGQVRRDLKAER